MKIAIVGAGFTGLTAALRLSQQGHSVVIFEKEKKVGGLAGTYKEPNWKYAVEKHYHHWFQNDSSAISLIKELSLSDDLFFAPTQTSTFYNGTIYPFNSPKDILSFTPLPLFDRLRLGIISAYLKALPSFLAISLEKWTAVAWIKKYYGEKSYRIVWKPLLKGKFGPYTEIVNAAWFWARIKKRTFKLGYIKGGYQTLLSALEKKVKDQGVVIKLGISTNRKALDSYDKVIITTPTPVFLSLYPELSKFYRKQLESVPRLHALNLLLISKEKILPETYWLNINDRSYPFIAVVQQTNLTNSSWYGGKNLTYVGNYLPENHPFLTMSAPELFKKFLPYLKKINPTLHLQPTTYNLQLFKGLYAQPVFPINYSKIKPAFATPLTSVFLANMDMVYPWDRGTNYAIKMGEEVAICVGSCIK
jgi:protoporphyrinogen oxidase